MPLTTGNPVILDIERAVAGGRMLARHEGQVVFVSGAVPGERVQAVVERVARGTVFAATREVLTPSPDRRAGATSGCGGAVYGHIGYPRQVELKASVIEDAWRRVGRLVLPGPVSVVPSPERGYRSRARLHASGTRLGFYREGTHQLCDPAETGQLSDATMAWVKSLEDRLGALDIRGLVALELVEDASGRERACHLATAPGTDWRRLDALAETLTGLSVSTAVPRGHDGEALNPDERLSTMGGTVLAGDPSVVDHLSVARTADGPPVDVRLRHDVRSFFQGNRFLLQPLVQHVVDAALDGPALDLYAGTGLFGLSVAAGLRVPVVLVEGDAWSGQDLAVNAVPFAGLVQVEQESVEEFVFEPCGGCRTWIVDPPRTGLSGAVRAAIGRDQPERVVYVSCDVPTLARDVRALTDGGYEAVTLTGFDLFPSTAHVECVCVLDRAIGHGL
jgi:23S rRNA (uracil1939-C5)-methyltransferase